MKNLENKQKCVEHYSLRDMAKYLRATIKSYEYDRYLVKPCHLNNKETRRLNRALGISNINYIGNTNGYKN